MDDEATRRIFIVNDDRDVASALHELLKRKDCDSLIVVNGPDGLQAVKSSHFDAAIVDLVMPEMDGIETCHIPSIEGVQHTTSGALRA